MLAQASGGDNGLKQMVIMFAVLAPIWYFLLIRPQQKQAKQQQSLLAALKKGDEVVTQSGLLGRIDAITDKVVTLEIAKGVRVRVLLSSIQGKAGTQEEAVAPAAAE